jgi:hypothetical protein
MGAPFWSEEEKKYFLEEVIPKSYYSQGYHGTQGRSFEDLAAVMQRDMDARGLSRRKYNGDILFQHWYQKVRNPDPDEASGDDGGPGDGGTPRDMGSPSKTRTNPRPNTSKPGRRPAQEEPASYSTRAASLLLTHSRQGAGQDLTASDQVPLSSPTISELSVPEGVADGPTMDTKPLLPGAAAKSPDKGNSNLLSRSPNARSRSMSDPPSLIQPVLVSRSKLPHSKAPASQANKRAFDGAMAGGDGATDNTTPKQSKGAKNPTSYYQSPYAPKAKEEPSKPTSTHGSGKAEDSKATAQANPRGRSPTQQPSVEDPIFLSSDEEVSPKAPVAKRQKTGGKRNNRGNDTAGTQPMTFAPPAPLTLAEQQQIQQRFAVPNTIHGMPPNMNQLGYPMPGGSSVYASPYTSPYAAANPPSNIPAYRPIPAIRGAPASRGRGSRGGARSSTQTPRPFESAMQQAQSMGMPPPYTSTPDPGTGLPIFRGPVPDMGSGNQTFDAVTGQRLGRVMMPYCPSCKRPF